VKRNLPSYEEYLNAVKPKTKSRAKNPAPLVGKSAYYKQFVYDASAVADALKMDNALSIANIHRVMMNMALPADNVNYKNTFRYMPHTFDKNLYDNGGGNSYDSEWFRMSDAKHQTIYKAALKNAGRPGQYNPNPAPRVGTARPRRASQITKKPPTKRLVKRRVVNTKKGYFPNPVDPVEGLNEWGGKAFKFAIVQRAIDNNASVVALIPNQKDAVIFVGLLNKHAAKGVLFYVMTR
jgi:hypothetical protein